MKKGGVSLEEPELVEGPCQIGVEYDAITEDERLRITGKKLIDNLKVTADWNRKSSYLKNMRHNPDEKKESRKLVFGMFCRVN